MCYAIAVRGFRENLRSGLDGGLLCARAMTSHGRSCRNLSKEMGHRTNIEIVQTRSAHSPVSSPSVAVSLPVPLFPPRCTELSSSAENTFTSSQNTPDTRRDTRTWLHTFHQLSVLRRVIKLPSVNADLCPRLYVLRHEETKLLYKGKVLTFYH